MQYRSEASGYAPHLPQRRTDATSCTPQCMQNWSPASMGLRHCGQIGECCCGRYPAEAPDIIPGIGGGGIFMTGRGIDGNAGAVGAVSAATKSVADAYRFSSRAYDRRNTSSK